ncbi:MAG: hypothetical protein ACFCUE_15570 [Candidatus Bathyarchaeia archaeon]|jgi:DNA-binding MarR family transcriptional regulator
MFTQTPDDQANTQILQLLNKHQTENPNTTGLDRAIIQATTRLTQSQLERHMLDLQKKALITLRGGEDSRWVFAEITPEGIKEITNDNPQNAQELFLTTFDEMTEVFKQARYRVRETGLSTSNKSKIEKHLKALEVELQKGKKIELGKIQKVIKELNQNYYEITPEVSIIVLKTIKSTLNLK